MLFHIFQKRQGQYILKTSQSRMSPSEVSFADQPLSIISLGPAPPCEGPASVCPAPRRKKTPKKPQPKDIPVQIYCGPPPSAPNVPTAPPPPPPPPPLPPTPATRPPPVKAASEDKPMPLSEIETPLFPAKQMLRQNIGERIMYKNVSFDIYMVVIWEMIQCTWRICQTAGNSVHWFRRKGVCVYVHSVLSSIPNFPQEARGGNVRHLWSC